jgi:SAM-dependent methyltransferase
MNGLTESQILHYSSAAWTRTDDADVSEHLAAAFSRFSRMAPGKFLDLGCATSPVGRALLPLNWNCHGVEVAASGQVARDAGVSLHGFDLSGEWSADLAGQSFDAVLAAEIIEHLIDTDRFLANIFAVLRCGGTAIITTPNLTSLENRARMLCGIHPRFMDFGIEGDTIGHVRYYTARKLREQMQRHGFRDVKIATVNARVGKIAMRPIRRLMNAAGLSLQLLASAVK